MNIGVAIKFRKTEGLKNAPNGKIVSNISTTGKLSVNGAQNLTHSNMLLLNEILKIK
jgi:hypothetical protein